MARVFCLHYDKMHHRPSGTLFEAVKTVNEDGKPVMRGFARVSDAVAREHFLTRPEHFRVEFADSETVTPAAPADAPALVPILPPMMAPMPVAETPALEQAAAQAEATAAKRGPGRPRKSDSEAPRGS